MPWATARETDSLVRVRSDPHDPRNKRARRMAHLALMVLVVSLLAFVTSVIFRPTDQDSENMVEQGDISPDLRAKKKNHNKKSPTKFSKNRYNDAASSIVPVSLVSVDSEDDNADIEEANEDTEQANEDTEQERLSEAEVNAGTDTPLLSKSHNSHIMCNDGGYSKRTLKRAYEMPFAALFQDNRGQKKFEASDVIIVDKRVYAICDSLWSISAFDLALSVFSPTNIQIGDPERRTDDESGYEALLFDDGHFYVVRESVLHHSVKKSKGGKELPSYHAIVEQLSVSADGTDYDVVEECRSEFEFEGDSKGFEGAIAVHALDGTLTLLGLCEGNHCSEERKNDRGHGMVIVMQKVADEAEGCLWKMIRRVKLPKSVDFKDYSAITIDDQDRIAVTSQEDSRLYVGKMEGKVLATGLWDIDAIEFDHDDVVIYDFPKNDNCETVYCNIEGIHWLDNNMLLAVSDKMKSKGKQHFRCLDKDQSVHAFVLP